LAHRENATTPEDCNAFLYDFNALRNFPIAIAFKSPLSRLVMSDDETNKPKGRPPSGRRRQAVSLTLSIEFLKRARKAAAKANMSLSSYLEKIARESSDATGGLPR
jgi:hypothetical protein